MVAAPSYARALPKLLQCFAKRAHRQPVVVAPAGAETAPTAPTAAIRSPRTRSAPFSITFPSPRMSRAPSKKSVAPAVVEDGTPPPDADPESDGAHPPTRVNKPIVTMKTEFIDDLFSIRGISLDAQARGGLAG